MVGQEAFIQRNLTTGCGVPLGEATSSSVWDKQDRSRRTDLSVKGEDWKISSEILGIAAPTGEPLFGMEEKPTQEEAVSVQKEEILGTQAVTVLVSPKETRQYSQAFRDHKRREILGQAIEHLQKFRESLNTPEAAMHIHFAKKSMEESWEFITEEDQEIRLTLSALEGAIRQQKWRDYKPHQVATLQTILEECVGGKLRSRKDVLKRISKLYKQDIDIFPSAPEWAYEEDDGTEA